MAMNIATLLQHLNSELSQPASTLSPAGRAEVTDWLENKLQGPLKALAKESERIRLNRRLSVDGQADELQKKCQEFLPYFAWTRGEVERHDKVLVVLRARLFRIGPAQPETDPMLRLLEFLRWQEVRGDFQDLAPHERDDAFVHAAEADDEDVMAALLSNPGASWISEPIKREALEERAQRRQPKEWAEYVESQAVRAYWHHWRVLLGRMFRDVGVPTAAVSMALGEAWQDALDLPEALREPVPA